MCRFDTGWFKHRHPRRSVSLRHKGRVSPAHSRAPPSLRRRGRPGHRPARSSRSGTAPPLAAEDRSRSARGPQPPPGLTWPRVAGDEAAPTAGAGPGLGDRRGWAGREPLEMAARGKRLRRWVMAAGRWVPSVLPWRDWGSPGDGRAARRPHTEGIKTGRAWGLLALGEGCAGPHAWCQSPLFLILFFFPLWEGNWRSCVKALGLYGIN